MKIGIYGGTFNPPHIGHVKAAEALSSAISPDLFLIMPDNLPPHKSYSGSVSADDRLKMCEIAFSHIKNVAVSDQEIKRGGKSFTSVTLEELASSERELYFLCGTDMFLTLPTWYRAQVIFDLAVICLVRREFDEDISAKIKYAKEDYEKRFSARIIEIPCKATVLSSSEVREALSSGGLSTDIIPDSVLSYIREKGIYR